MEYIFLTNIIVVFYTIIGYPLVLVFLSLKNKGIIGEEDIGIESPPKITVVLCIYNAANILEKRITNIFSGDYPEDKIRLVIVSDGSTDDPRKVISDIANPNVTFIEYNTNRGKAYALNKAMEIIETKYVAFTDVRQNFSPDALSILVKSISINNVGAVSGNLHILNKDSDSNIEQGTYWKYEKWIRRKESEVNSLIGVTGAIYIAKTKLVPNIPDNSLLDDMYIPLSIIRSGFKVKLCNDAIAYDHCSSSLGEEFDRKVRTLAGNFQLMSHLPWLYHPKNNPVFFQFFSHKILRLTMPYSLAIILISSLYSNNVLLNLFFYLQAVFYSYSTISYMALKTRLPIPLSSFCTSFCSLQLAALISGWKYFFSSTDKLWKKH